MATIIKSEQTKIDAMAFLSLSKMPKKLRKEDCYTTAVLKVKKYDGNSYYVIQRSDSNGNLKIVKDFEEMYSILRIEEIYPIDPFLPEINGKGLEVNSQEEKIDFVIKHKRDNTLSREQLEILPEEEVEELCKKVLRAIKISTY